MAGKLTDLKLRGWIKAGAPVAATDGDGLMFTLSGAGTAAWVWRYRIGQRRREYSIGRYPDFGLKEARAESALLRARVARGEDVATQKRIEAARLMTSGTFREVADAYLIHRSGELAEITKKESRRVLDRHILPAIGAYPVGSVPPAAVIIMVEALKERHAIARRVFDVTYQVFAYAMAKMVITAHPCAGLELRAIIGKPPTRKQRIKLTEDELRIWLPRLSAIGEANAIALKLLLLTCVRKSELLQAQWTEVDFDTALWNVPAGRIGNKKRRAYSVPLPPVAIAWLMRLHELAGNSPYVLPSHSRRRDVTPKHIAQSTLDMAMLRVDEGLRHFSAHDLRSTARGYLRDAGVDNLVIERCLNHNLPGQMVDVYEKGDFMEERRRALELWAARIEAFERGDNLKVIPLRRTA